MKNISFILIEFSKSINLILSQYINIYILLYNVIIYSSI